ncbi:hypothetical protein COCNU_scaffold028350G000030 [Cocos nucifera]|nr:hypothetical protein [Cocos nucifera]
MAAATAVDPWTTACSPERIILPGARARTSIGYSGDGSSLAGATGNQEAESAVGEQPRNGRSSQRASHVRRDGNA